VIGQLVTNTGLLLLLHVRLRLEHMGVVSARLLQ
jgi:hypothetical protein